MKLGARFAHFQIAGFEQQELRSVAGARRVALGAQADLFE